MEDSHIAQTNIVPDVSIFGVFDGHGGAEVALYVKKHFIPSLLKNEKFQNGDDRNSDSDSNSWFNKKNSGNDAYLKTLNSLREHYED